MLNIPMQIGFGSPSSKCVEYTNADLVLVKMSAKVIGCVFCVPPLQRGGVARSYRTESR